MSDVIEEPREVERLTADEARALRWAADRGIAILLHEGWGDMKSNVPILRSARDKIKDPDA